MKMKTMKNKILWYPAIIVLCIVCAHCTKYDEYKKYMPDGEIIYPQKADSVKIYPGNKRVLLEWVIVDPKVTSCKVFYEHEGIQGEMVVPINAGSNFENDTIRVIIPDLEETVYVFKIVSYDDFGNSSLSVEVEGRVFGEMFERSLLNRVLNKVKYKETEGLTLEWFAADANEIGIKFDYTDTNGNHQTMVVDQPEMSTLLPDFKISESFFYSTMYKPLPTAIDTFYVEPVEKQINPIPVINRENVVLYKPVTHSDALNATSPGQNAVDGNRTDAASRWVSTDTRDGHWIEVDLQGFFTVSEFQMWRQDYALGSSREFKLQVRIDGAWIDVIYETNAGVPVYYKEFEPITTDRIRLYFLPFSEQRDVDAIIRLYEIEVWSIEEIYSFY